MNENIKAKQIFLKYKGSYFHMERDGELSTYRKFDISRDTELKWAKEYQKKLILQIEDSISDIQVAHLCEVMCRFNDDEYIDRLFKAINRHLADTDTFIRLRIAEEFLELLNYFISNKIGHEKKLLSYKEFVLKILENIISQSVFISMETRSNVVFKDTIKEENIKNRARLNLKKLRSN